MENTQKNTGQQEPEWPPIDDTPPKRGLSENVIIPSFLPLGILMVLAAIADALFFNVMSREDQMAVGVCGVFSIWAWAMSKVMGD
jgi:hypothetical protein